jgi:hypothetical protein
VRPSIQTRSLRIRWSIVVQPLNRLDRQLKQGFCELKLVANPSTDINNQSLARS